MRLFWWHSFSPFYENTGMEIKRNEATVNRPEGDRVIDASYVFVDIPAFIEQVRREKAWEKNDRNGITVFKSADLTILITAMQAAAVLKHNNVKAFMTVQVMEGEVRIETQNGDVDMRPGNMIAFHPGIPHTIHAITDMILLISIYDNIPD
jgi:quercetin dioxygenase-like cupin family protein